LKKPLFILVIFALQGCAGINIYSDPSLDKSSQTGIPFYAPKPYLLIKRTGAKDKPIDISVIYIPDTSKTFYAKPKAGFGSSNLSLTFQNGVLTTFGQEVDSKVTELISAIAGVPGQLAGADKIDAETKQILDGLKAQNQSSNLKSVGKEITLVISDLGGIRKDRDYANLFQGSEKGKIVAVEKNLTKLAASFGAVGAEIQRAALFKSLKGEIAKLTKIVEVDRGTITKKQSVLVKKLADATARLTKLVDSEKPKPAAKPTIELYEIDTSSNGKLGLIPIQ